MIGMALFLVALGLAASVPQAQAETVTQTRYLRYINGTQTDMLLWHFGLNYTVNDVAWSVWSMYWATAQQGVRFGIQVYNASWLDNEYMQGSMQVSEMTSGVTQIWEKLGLYEGYLSGTWDCPNVTISRQSLIYIDLYAKFKTSATAWSSWYIMTNTTFSTQADCGTEWLGMDSIVGSTWNITTYAKITHPLAAKHLFELFYGTDGVTTYETKIENMQFDNGTFIEENNMLPVGFLLGALIILPIGILIAKKR